MIEQLIKAFLLGWFITNFEPFKTAINLLPKNLFRFYLMAPFSCIKCASFWVSLIMYHNIFIAAATSLLAYLFDSYVAPKFKIN